MIEVVWLDCLIGFVMTCEV